MLVVLAKTSLDDTRSMWENVLWSDEAKADFLDAMSFIMSGGKQTQHSTVKASCHQTWCYCDDRDALARSCRTPA